MRVDASSAIFGAFKQAAGASGRVTVGEVIDGIIAKGYTQEDVQACLREYEEMGAWTHSQDVVEFKRL